MLLREIMAQARFIMFHEVVLDRKSEEGYQLCFQYGRYEYGNDIEPENGYRFIWRRPNGNMQAARGQARIPSIADIKYLISKAKEEGWGNYEDDKIVK